ncbi:MAG: hypothetical protein JNK85_05525 [Verrucomicrobiales bacterium]|nr:hypothetical protein [Verrucomicrobiales bacterium]
MKGDEAALGLLEFVERGREPVRRLAVGVGLRRLGSVRRLLGRRGQVIAGPMSIWVSAAGGSRCWIDRRRGAGLLEAAEFTGTLTWSWRPSQFFPSMQLTGTLPWAGEIQHGSGSGGLPDPARDISRGRVTGGWGRLGPASLAGCGTAAIDGVARAWLEAAEFNGTTH